MAPLATQGLAWLADFHRVLAYVAIAANGLAGAAGLAAWRVRRWRGRWLWPVTVAAQAAMVIQVLSGVVMVASDRFEAPAIHLFYGFVAFLTVGIAYSYRLQMRGRREVLYGFVGMFMMGLGIQATVQVT